MNDREREKLVVGITDTAVDAAINITWRVLASIADAYAARPSEEFTGGQVARALRDISYTLDTDLHKAAGIERTAVEIDRPD